MLALWPGMAGPGGKLSEEPFPRKKVRLEAPVPAPGTATTTGRSLRLSVQGREESLWSRPSLPLRTDTPRKLLSATPGSGSLRKPNQAYPGIWNL